jgi:hypothetical protein
MPAMAQWLITLAVNTAVSVGFGIWDRLRRKKKDEPEPEPLEPPEVE